MKTRVARGIYRDAYGYEVRVYWRGRCTQQRFSPETPVRHMEDWQTATRRALEDADPLAPRDTVQEAARAYLHSAAFAALLAPRDRRRDVDVWIAEFGTTPTILIRPAEVHAILDTWRQAGYAPTTINHRVSALLAIVPRLRGHIRRLPPPRPRARFVPRERLVTILRAMRPGLTSARCWWLYWTGMRPSQLMRLRETAIDWEARLVQVPAGKGGNSYSVPLLPDAVAQLQGVTVPGVLGQPWSVSAADKTLAGYCRRLGVPPFTVYAFRRSFGQTLREVADLDDVRELLGHRDARTTRTHYAPAVPRKLREAVRVLGDACYTGGPLPLGD